MEADEWEEFILEWVDGLRQDHTYTEVHGAGGGGDMGCDIIGFKGAIGPQTPWDNYQCKHYNKPLSVADVVGELGKLCYHVAQGHFRLPDAYFFVTPRGPSTDLFKCLRAGTIKQQLMNRWDAECRNKITSTNAVELTPAIKAAIDAFDFSKVTVVPPTQIIEAHQKTRYQSFVLAEDSRIGRFPFLGRQQHFNQTKLST